MNFERVQHDDRRLIATPMIRRFADYLSMMMISIAKPLWWRGKMRDDRGEESEIAFLVGNALLALPWACAS